MFFETEFGKAPQKQSQLHRWIWCLPLEKDLTLDQQLEVVEKLQVFLKANCDRWAMQLEDTERNPHLQGVCKLKKRMRKSQLLKLLHSSFLTRTMYVDKCYDFESAVQYCTKQESRVCGPWTEKDLYDKAVEARKVTTLVTWQKALEEHVTKFDADGRSILWYTDLEGGKGKSISKQNKKVESCFKKHSLYIRLNGLKLFRV